MSLNTVKESDLHAYVDGALPEADREAITRFLAEHPDEAQRVRDYQMQKQAIAGLFSATLDEPIPETLRSLASPPRASDAMDRPHERPSFLPRGSLQRIAASVLIAFLGGIAGWVAHGQYPPAERLSVAVPLPRQAAIAHAVYSPDVRRPVEVSGEQEEQLVTWLSKLIGTPVKPPKLGKLGYELVGGRLLPGNIGPVAQFMYQDGSGQRLTLFVSTENTANRETAFRFAREGTVNVFYWIDGKFGYALSGTLEKGELARLATAVYEQIEGIDRQPR